MLINLLLSLFMGALFGCSYAYLFFREKRDALLRHIEAYQNGESSNYSKQAKILSIQAILRYFLVLGPLAVLIYKSIISPISTVLAFIISFWVIIFFMSKRKI